MKPGDLVIIAVYNDRLLLPHEHLSGVVLDVRRVEDDATRWIDGVWSLVPGEYTDVLVNDTVMVNIPTRWMRVISETG